MNLVGQAVLSFYMQTYLDVLINKSRTAWPVSGYLFYFFKKVLIILRQGSKHAQFWFGVQFPFKI